ncbi:MAG: hypothetical protein RL684_2480 [Pseudomonadota bacterium]|jgi:hypothetical protein
MRTIRWLTALAALALAACGGGSGGCNGSFAGSNCSSGGSGAATSILVTSDVATIPTDGSVLANISALVKDANNNAVAGVTVSFSAPAGSLVVTKATTDVSGIATATLSGIGVTSGTPITVKATAGSISSTVGVSVVNSQRTVSVVTSDPQIPSDGSKSATITALVRDANNNVVQGAPVSFQASSGAISALAAQTDATGSAKATLAAGSDPSNRTITVTVNSGSASTTIQVLVVGTTLSISGPQSLILGGSGSYTVVLANSAGQGIPNATVAVTSALGNMVSMPPVTNVNGQTTFTVTAANGGSDSLTATALGLQKAYAVSVSTDSFTFSTPPNSTSVNLGVSQAVTVNWLSSGAPKAGQTITFSATRGTLSAATAVTDASGNATVNISSTSAGPSIVSATGTGVSAQVTINFVATTPSQVAVQAGPATVAIGGSSTITATVRDASNNLVDGATVDFQVLSDPTSGTLQAASAVTSAGIATTSYTAGQTSSGANGVQIKATVRGTAITGTVSVTVGGQTVFLSLGTGNTVDINQGLAVYQITYTVFAVDATGAALANVPITLSVLPVAYGKGALGCPGGTNWTPVYTTAANDPAAYSGRTLCKNEDTDYTGNINSLVGKDYNTNGKLDPGNVAVVAPSSASTNAAGRVDVTITYPRDHSYWVMVSLVAKTTVGGTESSATSTFLLVGADVDYKCNIGPPGPVSPYGIATTCANPN